MKNIHNMLIALLFIVLTFPLLSPAQDSLTFELRYEVNRNYPPVSITKEKLTEANTLIDLNRNYHSSWVKEYISVQVRTSHKGKLSNAVSKNNTLSQEQKDIMNMADPGTGIAVKVRYIPDNNLTHNDIKEINFTFTVDPENEASFPGGQQQLKQYLKDNAIDKIPEGSFKRYQLTAVKFTIDEQGKIIDAHVFESSKDEKVDELLLEAIRNMPTWEPAEYANGHKVKQEFVFTVGDMESCVINLLNIRYIK